MRIRFRTATLAITVAVMIIATVMFDPADAAAATSCTCHAGVDNFCLYGEPIAGCDMTQPGGYCDPNGDGDFSDADWVRGWTDFRDACSDVPPQGSECGCRDDVDNFCLYGPTAGCEMTLAGGYCDPNGDGNFNDADWVRGWTEFQAACVESPPPAGECDCRDGVDNFCLYGPTADCAMTLAGGYCDPNGDGDLSDADWVRGWTDFRDRCSVRSVPTPTPGPTPSGETRPRRIGIEGPICLYYDVQSTAWGVRPGARIINNGTATETIVMQLYAEPSEPAFGDPLDGPLLATGFFGFALPPHKAFVGQFSFHHDVPQPAPPNDDVLVIAVVSVTTGSYTDFVSFGRIDEHFPRPTFTTCIDASPTRAP